MNAHAPQPRNVLTQSLAQIGGCGLFLLTLLAAIPRSVAAGDPVAGLTDLFPEEVLRLLCAAVGTKRADGSVDHVLRMPAARSLPSGAFGVAELPPCSPIIRTRSALREVLGLG